MGDYRTDTAVRAPATLCSRLGEAHGSTCALVCMFMRLRHSKAATVYQRTRAQSISAILLSIGAFHALK